jgi:hypothetical protein
LSLQAMLPWPLISANRTQMLSFLSRSVRLVLFARLESNT